MANQNVGTPRFIIDYIQYFQVNGLAKSNYASNNHYFWNAPSPWNSWEQETANHMLSLIGLNPVHDFTFTGMNVAGSYNVDDEWVEYTGWNYVVRMDKSFPVHECNIVGLLGHNIKTTGGMMGFEYFAGGGVYPNAMLTDDFEVNVTRDGSSKRFSADFDGFSFCSCNGAETALPVYDHIVPNIRGVPDPMEKTYKPGSLLWGRYYDMPHSPELSLTMSHEYDGIKKQETAGGSTLGYVNYYKPPDWGDDLQAWQLDGWDRKYSGRRVWDLAFNYLSDFDIEPYHYNMDESHPDWNEDGNWFTNVLHYNNGGQLPFIFCPDPSIPYYTSSWTIPEFAICRFDMKTFKREQVANGVYNIKVKIKESW